MNKPSLKKIIITSLAYTKKVSELENNSLILVTAAGIITGNIINVDDEDITLEKRLIPKLLTGITENYNKEFSLDHQAKMPGNDGYLILENAKILNTNDGSTANLHTLTVFFDQIIGVTIGNI